MQKQVAAANMHPVSEAAFPEWVDQLLLREQPVLAQRLQAEVDLHFIKCRELICQAAKSYLPSFSNLQHGSPNASCPNEGALTSIHCMEGTDTALVSHSKEFQDHGNLNDSSKAHLTPVIAENAKPHVPAGPTNIMDTTEQGGGNGGDPCNQIAAADVSPSTSRYSSKKLNDLAGHQHENHEGQTSVLHRIVKSNSFEACSAGFIVLAMLVMCVEIQYNSFAAGYDLQLEGYRTPGTEVWPWATSFFNVMEVFLNSIFAIEFVLRMLVLKQRTLMSGWMWLDAFLIFISWVDYLNLMSVGMDPMILRLFRLVRLLRLLKVLKAFKIVETLFLLIKSIQSSFSALLWSFTLLWFLQISMGIVLCQILNGYIIDESKPRAIREEVFKYFGTVANTILTMFEISLGNWVVTCRLLYDNVSKWYGAFYILYRCCFMFAVMKVITAVFISETNRCAASDDELALTKRQRQKEAYGAKLKEVFNELDTQRDGYLSWDEIKRLLDDNLLKDWLQTLEIDTQDLSHLFTILDDGDGRLDLNEFTSSLSRVRGPAKSMDLLKVMNMVVRLDRKIDKHLQAQRSLEHRIPSGDKIQRPDLHDELIAISTQISTKVDTMVNYLILAGDVSPASYSRV